MWSSSFRIVCNCFDGFRPNPPKNIGRFHRKENTNFPKRRLVRSKSICLSSALLFYLAVTTKINLRPSWDLSTWNNTCLLFKCRVTFRLRQFSKFKFGTLALYILRLRCLAIPNTYKNSFWFFSEMWSSSFRIVCNCFDDFRTSRPKNIGRSHRKENTNFPKWRWVRSKKVCLSSAVLFPLVVTKKHVLRTSSGLSTWNNTCFLFRCSVTFGCDIFRTLRPVLWLFTSCVWDVLCYRILIKSACVSWAKKILSNTMLSTFQKCLFGLCRACLFGGNWKICFEKFLRSLYLK